MPDALHEEGRTSIFIQDTDHPVAGGMSGEVDVYDWPYSLNWGNPLDDADVVASILEDRSFPPPFVYEKGYALVDGSIAPNTRIDLFLGQAASSIAAEGNNERAAGAPRWHYLSEAGRTHLMNKVNFAAGASSGGDGGGAGDGASMITGTSLTADGVVVEGTGTVATSRAPGGSYAGSIPLPATFTPDQSALFIKANN